MGAEAARFELISPGRSGTAVVGRVGESGALGRERTRCRLQAVARLVSAGGTRGATMGHG